MNNILGIIKRKTIIIGTYKFIETNSFTNNIVNTDILWIILYIIKKSIYIKWKIYSNRRKQKIKKIESWTISLYTQITSYKNRRI